MIATLLLTLLFGSLSVCPVGTIEITKCEFTNPGNSLEECQAESGLADIYPNYVYFDENGEWPKIVGWFVKGDYAVTDVVTTYRDGSMAATAYHLPVYPVRVYPVMWYEIFYTGNEFGETIQAVTWCGTDQSHLTVLPIFIR